MVVEGYYNNSIVSSTISRHYIRSGVNFNEYQFYLYDFQFNQIIDKVQVKFNIYGNEFLYLGSIHFFDYDDGYVKNHYLNGHNYWTINNYNNSFEKYSENKLISYTNDFYKGSILVNQDELPTYVRQANGSVVFYNYTENHKDIETKRTINSGLYLEESKVYDSNFNVKEETDVNSEKSYYSYDSITNQLSSFKKNELTCSITCAETNDTYIFKNENNEILATNEINYDNNLSPIEYVNIRDIYHINYNIDHKVSSIFYNDVKIGEYTYIYPTNYSDLSLISSVIFSDDSRLNYNYTDDFNVNLITFVENDICTDIASINYDANGLLNHYVMAQYNLEYNFEYDLNGRLIYQGNDIFKINKFIDRFDNEFLKTTCYNNYYYEFYGSSALNDCSCANDCIEPLKEINSLVCFFDSPKTGYDIENEYSGFYQYVNLCSHYYTNPNYVDATYLGANFGFDISSYMGVPCLKLDEGGNAILPYAKNVDSSDFSIKGSYAFWYLYETNDRYMVLSSININGYQFDLLLNYDDEDENIFKINLIMKNYNVEIEETVIDFKDLNIQPKMNKWNLLIVNYHLYNDKLQIELYDGENRIYNTYYYESGIENIFSHTTEEVKLILGTSSFAFGHRFLGYITGLMCSFGSYFLTNDLQKYIDNLMFLYLVDNHDVETSRNYNEVIFNSNQTFNAQNNWVPLISSIKGNFEYKSLYKYLRKPHFVTDVLEKKSAYCAINNNLNYYTNLTINEGFVLCRFKTEFDYLKQIIFSICDLSSNYLKVFISENNKISFSCNGTEVSTNFEPNLNTFNTIAISYKRGSNNIFTISLFYNDENKFIYSYNGTIFSNDKISVILGMSNNRENSLDLLTGTLYDYCSLRGYIDNLVFDSNELNDWHYQRMIYNEINKYDSVVIIKDGFERNKYRITTISENCSLKTSFYYKNDRTQTTALLERENYYINDNSQILSFEYTYDDEPEKIRNIINIKEIHADNSYIESNYTYDQLNRISTCDTSNNGQIIHNYEYNYDSYGNITSVYDSGMLVKIMTYDSANNNHLTRFNNTNYHFDGNRLKYISSSFFDIHLMDFHFMGNMLDSVVTTNFSARYYYDVENIRRKKEVTQNGNIKSYEYYYNEDKKLQYLIADNYRLKFYYDDLGRLAYFEKYNQFDILIKKYIYVLNSLNDVVGIIDSSNGNIVARYCYSPFGEDTSEEIYGAQTTDAYKINPFKYRSYFYDEETNFYYLKARYYNPNICRFISADKTGYLEEKEANGYNLFSYARNNPILYEDPNGRLSKLVLIFLIFFSNSIINLYFSAFSKKRINISHFEVLELLLMSLGEFFIILISPSAVIGSIIYFFVSLVSRTLSKISKLAYYNSLNDFKNLDLDKIIIFAFIDAVFYFISDKLSNFFCEKLSSENFTIPEKILIKNATKTVINKEFFAINYIIVPFLLTGFVDILDEKVDKEHYTIYVSPEKI